MEPVARWFLGFEGLATALQATEWVGVAVLVCAVTSVWTSARASHFRWKGPSARTVGISALATILAGIWSGVSIHLFLGTVILATGCCLSLWSLLLWFGVSWRQHIRPGITPTLLIALTILGLWQAPRGTALALLAIAFWARRTTRLTTHAVDLQLNALSTRALALTNYEAASYMTNAWFQRFAPHASNLSLLALAYEARQKTVTLPRARRIMHASDALHSLASFAEDAVDQRMRTDGAAARSTSWIRALTLEFVRQVLHRSGIVWLFRIVSDLLLAVPQVREESWADRAGREGATMADPEGYVLALIADLPPVLRPAELEALRTRVTRDADAGGPAWLTSAAAQAEIFREETPNPDRDLRMEIVAEVLWGVYESAIGPRPSRYELYDQVRLQVPEMVERSSVREVRVEDGALVMQLEGMPRSFHEVGPGNHVIVQTPDDFTWSFRRLETTDTGVVLLFAPHDSAQGPRRLPKPDILRPARKGPKKAAAAALAAAASQ